MDDCKHKKRFPVARGSLWSKWDWFCLDCGICPADPCVPPRPDLALEERGRNVLMAESIEVYEAMTPEERETHQASMVSQINERLKSLEEQLKPYQGNTYRPFF